jgi:rubrerythrin
MSELVGFGRLHRIIVFKIASCSYITTEMEMEQMTEPMMGNMLAIMKEFAAKMMDKLDAHQAKMDANMKAMQEKTYANLKEMKEDMKADQKEMTARLETKMDDRQEKRTAQMASFASRIEKNNEKFEVLRDTFVSGKDGGLTWKDRGQGF